MTKIMTNPNITIPIMNSGLFSTGSSVVGISVTLKSGVTVASLVDEGSIVAVSTDVVVVVSIVTTMTDTYHSMK